jgi:hypothetical protein
MNSILKFFNLNSGKSKLTFYLNNIKVSIAKESNGIRLITDDENWFIPRQTLNETKTIIEKNVKIIQAHFQDKLGATITEADLSNVSLKIALRYFQMYNHWRTIYKRETNRDLTFMQKDFEHPYTLDTIVDYFKSQYPNNYIDKCQVMLNMTTVQVKDYVIRKEQFDNL